MQIIVRRDTITSSLIGNWEFKKHNLDLNNAQTPSLVSYIHKKLYLLNNTHNTNKNELILKELELNHNWIVTKPYILLIGASKY